MSLTLLRFKGFSEIYGNDGLGLLVLTTEDETRQLSVVCDRWTLRQFTLRRRAPATLADEIGDAALCCGRYEAGCGAPNSVWRARFRESWFG